MSSTSGNDEGSSMRSSVFMTATENESEPPMSSPLAGTYGATSFGTPDAPLGSVAAHTVPSSSAASSVPSSEASEPRNVSMAFLVLQ